MTSGLEMERGYSQRQRDKGEVRKRKAREKGSKLQEAEGSN